MHHTLKNIIKKYTSFTRGVTSCFSRNSVHANTRGTDLRTSDFSRNSVQQNTRGTALRNRKAMGEGRSSGVTFRSRLLVVFMNSIQNHTKELSIHIAPVSGVCKLDGILVDKFKNDTPVTRNTKRQKTKEWGRQMLCVKSRVVWIFAKVQNKCRQFYLLRLWKFPSAFYEMRVVDYLKHFLKVLQERIFCQKNVVWGEALMHGVQYAQTQDDSCPQGHVQLSSQQVSEAFSFLQRVKYYSWYLHSTLVFCTPQDDGYSGVNSQMQNTRGTALRTSDFSRNSVQQNTRGAALRNREAMGKGRTSGVKTFALVMSTVKYQYKYVYEYSRMACVGFVLCTGVVASLLSLTSPLTALASETLLDSTVFATNVQGNNSSPTSVWITDQIGYTFYLGAEGDLEMASTTNGGATWLVSNAVDSVNTTDVVSYAIWWDGWTAPGTTTQYIHIATTDTTTNRIYYTRFDTTNNTFSLSTTTSTQAAACTRGSDCQVSITKASDDVLYVAAGDTSDSWVDSCATTCTSTANWSERVGGFYQGLGDDYPILTPIAGTNNVMLVYWDISADELRYNIYSATSSAWQWATNATQTLASTKDDNGTYDGQLFGMSVSTTTGTTSLVLVDDANDYTTADHDINFYTYSSTTGWVARTNPVTTAPGGLTGAKVAFDEVNKIWYVIYTRRSTIGTAVTGDIYYRTSADNGTTWSGEQGPVNDTPDDINGLTTGISSAERIGVWWSYTTAPRDDDEYYNVVADFGGGGEGAPITLSGTLYSDEGVTAITTGKTVAIAIGTSTVSLHATTSTASGAWSFTVPAGQSVRASTPILVWIDGDATTRATLFTKSAGFDTTITNLDLYQNRVILSHQGTSTTIADMYFYDSDDDADIQYNADSVTHALTVHTGNKLYIQTGKTFIPGGSVTVNGNGSSTSLTDGSFLIPNFATYIQGGTTTIAGSFNASSSAQFYNNGGLLNFTATTTGKSIIASVSPTLGNVTFSGTASVSFSAVATTTNLTINAGATAVAPASLPLKITGNFTQNGTFTQTTGTTTLVNAGGGDWTARSAAQANQWKSVTYGNGLFVAVSDSGTNRVQTSPDGITWTVRSASNANQWLSITYGNGLFVAVSATTSTSTAVMTSPDGITWTARSASEPNLWYTVTYGNGLFVAVSWNGTNRVMTSPDGITWTARTASEANSWYSVTYGNGLFVAISYDGTNRVMTSSDGITWSPQAQAVSSNAWRSVTYGNGLFVAVGNSSMMTSPDGITWTARSASEANTWNSVTYGNGLFVAVAESGTNRVMTVDKLRIHTSGGTTQTATGTMTGTSAFNGLEFTGAGVKTLSTNASSSTFWVNSGATAVAPALLSISGQYQNNGTTTFGSTGTTTFSGSATQTLSGTLTGTSAFNNVAFTGAGEKIFNNTHASTSSLTIESTSGVVTAPTSTISIGGNYRNDGTFRRTHLSWTARSASEANTWRSVTYGFVNGTGLFVAVSDSGTNRVMTSPDGITWTARTASEANSWYSVTYGLVNGTGLFVAVSYDGTNQVMTSPDGITWTARSASEANLWYSVTYGNGLFVAVSISGTNRVMTSPDGITWTARSASEANSWYSVTYSNGLFVAVAGSGTNRVMTSSDGITWTARSASEANQWISVTYGSGLFMAVAQTGTNRVMTSSDGITWTAHSASEANSWTSVTYGNGLFVAVSNTGTNRVMTSSDGITWTARSASEANTWNSVTYGNGLFVAVSNTGTNRVMTSNAGTTTFNGASAQTIGGTLNGASELGNVVFLGAGTKTFATTSATTSNFTIMSTSGTVTAPTSTLMIQGDYTNASTFIAPTTTLSIRGNFTQNGTFTAGVGTTTFSGSAQQIATGTMTGTSAFNNLEFSGIGNKSFITNASSSNFRINASTTVSAPALLSVGGQYQNDGRFVHGWGLTINLASEANQWRSVTYGNGLFVAVSISGTNRVMTSPDGITWTARSASEANSWYSVTYGNGLFVAVSTDGTNRVMTSPDGITWTARSASEANSWNSVTYGNGLFVAVAYTGTNRVMTSPDGITWTARSAPAYLWRSVTYGNGLFVAGGSSFQNNLMTSPDGITWTMRSNTAGSNQFYSVTYGKELFVVVTLAGSVQNVIVLSTGTTTFNSASAQTLGGTLSGASSLGSVVMSGAGTKTFSSSASTTNVVVEAGATAVAPTDHLSISGNYTNSGIVTYSTGTTTLDGTATQTLSGTMTGTSAFNNLHITNTSGSGSSTQSIIFANSASTTDTFTMNASTSARFLASATSTFQNISLSGASGQLVYLRSSSPNTQYNFSVPGTQKLVTYVDVRDSNACPTTITTTINTSYNSGNNTCWTIPAYAIISSTANQTFAYNQATTSMSTITITDNQTPTITSANDIRIVIATTSANMRFDTTDTTATVGGSASAKVSGTVSYLGNGEILVIDVTSDWSAGDTLTISDLSYAQFATVTTATTALGVRVAGVGTTTVSSDDKTISISGALTLADHTSGQIPDNFSASTQASTTLFVFALSPAGESASITSLVFSLSGISGIVTGDVTGATLYRDMNADRAYDAGDVAVGGSGVVSITGQSGTITFSTSFTATTSQNYVLVADVANLTGIDSVTIALTATNITTTGVTTALTITETGSISNVQHIRISRGGGGAIGGEAPAGQGVTTGGGQGGGDIVDPNSGDTIGNAVGFNAPSTNGTPFSAWTNGGNAYTSDGAYTTAVASVQHSYGTFGFMVPSNNTITGIAVKLEASGSTAAGTISVRLSWDGGTTVTSLATTGTLTTTDAVYTLGGASDLWGRSWTPAELDNGNFTIELVANPSSNTIQVDAIQVRVYHQATGGGGGGGGAVFKQPQRFFASVSTAFEPVREVLKDTLYTMLRWLFA